MEVFGEAEVDVGEVDEDGYVRFVLFDGTNELAVTGNDAWDLTEDFGDAHDGYVFGTDGLLLAGGAHLGSAEAVEGGGGEAVFELGDETGAVVVAGGFAGGEEEARVGCGGNDLSLVEGVGIELRVVSYELRVLFVWGGGVSLSG